MGDFGDAERRILGFMAAGTEFKFNGKHYTVVLSDKPTCYKGEPKTDIYILAKSDIDEIEIKISYKKKNADFIENKMNAERAEQLFGSDWENVIIQSTESVKNEFEKRMLIYKNAMPPKTEKGAITLGWKYELLNKDNGDLSGKVILDKEQLKLLVYDAYAGVNLKTEKKNAYVCGKIVKNCGIADFILMDNDVRSAQEVIDKMVTIEKYIDSNPQIYFACKALNLRSFVGQLKGEFQGEFEGKVQGMFSGKYQELEKREENGKKVKIYKPAVELNKAGKFEGKFEGYISGRAQGKFNGDMSNFRLVKKITAKSPKGSFKPKWDSDRPLAVQVEWKEEDEKLKPNLIFDSPLVIRGNKTAERLIEYMEKLQIRNTDDIDENNSDTDRII